MKTIYKFILLALTVFSSAISQIYGAPVLNPHQTITPIQNCIIRMVLLK